MTTMTKKKRSWIGGLLGVGVLVAVGWGAMPFGSGAQEPPPQSKFGLFDKGKCMGTCPPLPHEPGVECCAKKPLKPIIVRPR